MAKPKFIQENGETIIPITHEDAVLDNNGQSISSKYVQREDSSLMTTSKNVVDAINELSMESVTTESYTNGEDIQIEQIDYSNIVGDVTSLQTDVGDLSSLQTKDKSNLVGALNELFQDVDSGKQLIADAIDDGNITKNSTFGAMSEAITNIKQSAGSPTDGRLALYYEMVDKGYVDANETMSINELVNLLEDCDIDPNDVKQITCGGTHTFILKNDGSVWTCGYNGYGQLGFGNTTSKYTFTQVTTNINNDVKQIICGGSHTMIIKNDGSLWACGWNSYGQLGLGDDTNRKTFTKVEGMDSNIREVICGDSRTFIIKNDGTLWACGSNGYGQLGFGDTTHRYTFTQLTTNVKQVACGYNHTLVLKTDGSVWGCGQNNYGQLGLGDSTTKETLTQITTNVNNDVKQIDCGNSHTFILKNDGSIWGCGHNGYGQLGLGNTTSSKYTFILVITNVNNDVKQIGCGGDHTFILKNDGSVYSCGYNNNGQLGLNDTTNRNTFTQVTLNINNDVKQVFSDGTSSFILKNDGSLWVCGNNNYGQLGLDSNTTRYTNFTNTFPRDTSSEYQGKLKLWQFLKSALNLPVKGSMSIEELLEILIDKGDHLEDVLGDVKDTLINLMQDNNHSITDESLDSLLDLLKKSNIDISGIKQIACGSYHAVILKNDGSVWTTGYNNRGQLGLGDSSNRTTFTKVTTNINNDVKQIACGNQHTFILKKDGSVWSTGYNVSGQLGLGNVPNQTTFAQVTTNIDNVKQIACGNNSTIILKKDGSIWSCGYNSYGQLGLNDTSNRASFTQVTTNINNDVKQVFCGYNHTFILKNDGSLWASGYNNNGQLGLGDYNNRNTFTQVTTNINNDVKQVAHGQFHTLILKNDGSVWSCGQNNYGQLGLNDDTTRTTFTQVINNAKQIACGEYYTIIIKNDGSIWSSGVNDYGQLGLGDTTDRRTLTQVTTNINNDVKQVICGYYHAFIIKNDGSVYSCGLNDEGQSGFGDYSDRKTFTQVPRGL